MLPEPLRHCSNRLIGICLALATLVTGRFAIADGDVLPADSDIVSVIDHYIRERLVNDGIAPVEPANETTLLRRTTLDLAGRIPTTVERSWYLSLPEADRRRLLVERLMQSPDFDFHHRNWLDELLLPNRPYDNEFREYLLTNKQDKGQALCAPW